IFFYLVCPLWVLLFRFLALFSLIFIGVLAIFTSVLFFCVFFFLVGGAFFFFLWGFIFFWFLFFFFREGGGGGGGGEKDFLGGEKIVWVLRGIF
ncbi:hypothetical protein KFO60_13480, partial [Enterococcus faecalis]|uniref:hypothetical protein n=1 Tax=Enterococcus faecalis TaxID=1351 RepID=UPI001BA8F605